MRWTRDQQVSLIVGVILIEVFVAEMAIAASAVSVETALGWLLDGVLLAVVVVHILAERAGAGGPLRLLTRSRAD